MLAGATDTDTGSGHEGRGDSVRGGRGLVAVRWLAGVATARWLRTCAPLAELCVPVDVEGLDYLFDLILGQCSGSAAQREHRELCGVL